MPKKLLSTEEARSFLTKRYDNQKQNWLVGDGAWPLLLNLGVPTENDVAADPAGVRAWAESWSQWKAAGTVTWEERQFARLGGQRLPAGLVLADAGEVAVVAAQSRRWETASSRYARLVAKWPVLRKSTAITGRFSALESYAEPDFERLFSLLAWLDANPSSNLYLRQLPVEGLDTKWIEQRTAVVASLLRVIRGAQDDAGFFELCGLAKPPHRVRVRLLCPGLRRLVGGLRDIEAPVGDLAALPIAPTSIVIVENQETGLALPDMAGAVAIMRLGNAVIALDALPWLRGAKAMVYWGDIDTHGFAILDRARRVLPELRSVLMDEGTLLAHRQLWAQEPTQCPNVPLETLVQPERAVYEGLRANAWGQKVRLEQERIVWDTALETLIAALSEVPLAEREAPPHVVLGDG
ncbi:MAG TPA: Wadjet anti-phage system protein JetD domain-containing protein [Ideonella sp.]|uniref:Wadjet anti-phage system protein JetD domain-containing protein n=1 Tax=Ideonella sp. TaxID=1929293 RepID=UPI002B86E7EA|nr:Wadjet anti-phage system protein JetD domain-containing protein [Ideonella sp.]HSI49163.1 Wadjet anti-phage system protein JetD domain-containing protein [Ideonella sp.]